jgi:C-3',4' desaturase CrtD
MRSQLGQVIVIGGGVGGLATAAVLARAGLPVTVLEAHVYPGGCAGTFYHQGYRFDAGATLAGGFYSGGPMDLLARAAGVTEWPARPSDPAMVVHLPGEPPVARYGSPQRWEEYARAFGQPALAFWQWQERTADALWDLALRSPHWPPQSLSQGLNLLRAGLRWLAQDLAARLRPALLADFLRPVAAHLKNAPESLKLFVDAQLLISAQAESQAANALYGASALDLPRRGVVHLQGGMGAIADQLVAAIRRNGGKVLFRQEVTRIVLENGLPVAVETKRGGVFPAQAVIANLPPWNIAALLGDQAPPRLRRLPARPGDGWGAFMLYLGIDGAVLPDGFPLHHQVVRRRPLGEGNSIFVSLSPEWDAGRAPHGGRAVTISTHTDLGAWWDLAERDRPAYEARREAYAASILESVEAIIPGLRQAIRLEMPATPQTFQRFTRRAWGWVGGFPQTNLFRAWGPRLAPNLWMVGDSIFPGQSTAAVALGGMRVARDVLGVLTGEDLALARRPGASSPAPGEILLNGKGRV